MSTKSRTLTIPRRFCGPPTSGNGGYTCAFVARNIGGCAEVTLRKPIPLEREMQIVPNGNDAGVVLRDGDTLIAEGASVSWTIDETLATLSFDDAVTAAKASPAFGNHPFPTCFVCGPQRSAGDGLRIFPGPIGKDGRVRTYPAGAFAAPWIPDSSLAGTDGVVRDEFIWSALDCPTGFACGFPSTGTLVTGRLAAKLLAPVHVGEKCVLLSWPSGVDGRKHHAAAVLLGEDGNVRAEAKATWIKLG
jgi:hypothetical protein